MTAPTTSHAAARTGTTGPHLLTPALRHYDWGHPTTIPELLGTTGTGEPVAEAWYGAHPSAPSHTPSGTLDTVIATDPAGHLGPDIADRFGPQLPFLVKILAAAKPLSIQVHPTADAARTGYINEDTAGVPRTAPNRNYRDTNHKPEMVYALTPFEAMIGFRDPLVAAALLTGLNHPLAALAAATLTTSPTPTGLRKAMVQLLTAGSPDQVDDLVRRCARLADHHPAYDLAARLADHHPGDRGALVSFLLDHHVLVPGQAMFVPAGVVHAYVSGTAVEVMANSDNVLRAGLTTKHVDVAELLRHVDFTHCATHLTGQDHDGQTHLATSATEFAMTVLGTSCTPVTLNQTGPRILLCLDGDLTIHHPSGTSGLRRGQALFLPHTAGPAHVTCTGAAVLVHTARAA